MNHGTCEELQRSHPALHLAEDSSVGAVVQPYTDVQLPDHDLQTEAEAQEVKGYDTLKKNEGRGGEGKGRRRRIGGAKSVKERWRTKEEEVEDKEGMEEKERTTTRKEELPAPYVELFLHDSEQCHHDATDRGRQQRGPHRGPGRQLWASVRAIKVSEGKSNKLLR